MSPRPLVVAHRGASGERPEETRSAYELAAAQGADFLEVDLVVSRDGALIARHENELSGTTDIGSRPEFAARRTRKSIDGCEVDGWFAEDFTLSELKTLRCRERLPDLRAASAAFDGRDGVLTFAELIALARELSARHGRRIGVYAETKHPTFFIQLGLPLEPRVAEVLRAEGWAGADAPVFLQSFEPGSLKTLREVVEVPLVQLIAATGAPFDSVTAGEGATYAEMLTPAGLREVAGYADAIGPDKQLVAPRAADGASLSPTTLVEDAHAAGLKVHPWTYRAENLFLPLELRRGDDPAGRGDLEVELRQALELGVDGVFCDFPGVAAAVIKSSP